MFKMQLNLFLVFVSNDLSNSFMHFCKNIFDFDKTFFFP